MEIERKFLIKKLPDDLSYYECLFLEQAYLCTDPVIRIRRQNNDYYMTYKGKGLMTREEYNLPLNEQAYRHLLPKADGTIISKKRYLIPIEKPVFAEGFSVPLQPLNLKIELDILTRPFLPLSLRKCNFRMKRWQTPFFPLHGLWRM